MAIKLLSKTIEAEVKDGAKLRVFLRPFTADNNPALRGFANFSVVTKEGKMDQMANNMKVIETAEGDVFLKEPHQKAYTNQNGEYTSTQWYVVKTSIKEDLVKRILSEGIEK